MSNRPPTNPAYDLAAEYSGKAHAYARDWAPVLLQLTRPLFAALPLAHARRILDVGSGSGGHLSALQAAAPQATIYGTDIALGMLQAARPASNARLALMEVNRLGLRSESFDIAVSTFIFQHVADPAGAFGEIRRSLKPGGVIGLATWGQKDAVPASTIWAEELDRQGAGPDPRPDETYHDLVDAPERLEQLLRDAGFEAIRSWTEVGFVQWSRDGLMSTHAQVCSPSRRLRTLPAKQRDACMNRVRRRMDALLDDALCYRPEVVFSVARRRA